jgi:hypothetical protein
MVKVTIEELLLACESLAAGMAGPVDSATKKFVYPKNLSALIWRCVIKKSCDTFNTIVELIKSGRSWAALPLLRPMCEDFLYLSYLSTLDIEDADTAVRLWSQREVLEGLAVQERADRADAWSPGETLIHDGSESDRREIESRLRSLKEQLGTKGWKTGKGKPTALEAAESIEDGLFLYRVLYFGTSKHVHFSPHQLMRLVGCEDGVIGSVRRNRIFERLDAAFGLSYAANLIVFTSLTCQQMGLELPDVTLREIDEMAEKLRNFGRVPFVIYPEVQHGSLDADPRPVKQ